MGNQKREMREAAFVFIKKLLKLKRDQKILIYVDKGSDLYVAKALQDCAQEIGTLVELFELKSTLGVDDMVRDLVNKIEKGSFDIICELSEQLFYQTLVWKRALQVGSQIYSLGGVDIDGFIRCVGKVDHDLMFEFGMVLRQILKKTKTIQIITKKGTDVKFDMSNNNLFLRFVSRLKRKSQPYIIYPSGMLTQATKATFMGGQLAFQGISETIEGTAVIDGYLWPPQDIGPLDIPIFMKIKKGIVTDISGCPLKSTAVNEWFKTRNKEIQHFCIGFNPGAKLTGKIMEAERVFGSLSIGIGKFPFHTDGIIKSPSMLFNNEVIEQEGFFVNGELSILARNLIQDNEDAERVS
jgi:hypothetical protein